MLEETIETTENTVDEDGLFLRIWERVKDAIIPPKPDGVFTVQKDLKGQWRWVATYTNNFMDREGEIISDKALDGYLSRLDMGLVPMPELWAAHMPETKHGQADMVFAVGKFLIATGTFDDTPLAQKAIEYYRKNAAKVQLSHGFTYPKWALKGGVYEEINTFEITTLPPPLVASNPYTDMEVMSMKQITPDTEAALAQLFGKEETEKLIASRTEQSKALEAAGVAYKDFADVAGAEAAVEAAPAEEAKKPDPVATLLQTLLEDMAELVQTQADQGKAFAAYRAQVDAKVKELTDVNTAQKSQIEKMQAELKLTPRAASTAPETKLSETDAAAIKQEIAKSEVDTFWKA